MLRRVLSEYWRNETEKSKVFCGAVGLDGRCSAQAEQRKKPVAVGQLPGAYLSTETNLVPIRGVMRKEFETGQTHTHTHTHTHTRTHTELKRCGPPGPGASARDLQQEQLRYLCSTSTLSNYVIPCSIAITSDQGRKLKKVTFRLYPAFIRSCEHDIK